MILLILVSEQRKTQVAETVQVLLMLNLLIDKMLKDIQVERNIDMYSGRSKQSATRYLGFTATRQM